MQILVIDIGNTRASLGFFREEKMQWRRDILTDMFCARIETFVAEALDLCVVSCVSQKAASVLGFIRDHLHCPVLDVHSAHAPLTIHYEYPEKLGSDRIANALGSTLYAKNGAIVVDFGTATHFDIVDPNGEFWGGPILPGVELMLQALVTRIPHLPEPDLFGPVDAVSDDTESAIRTGILLTAVGGVERILTEIRKKCAYTPQILMTGGNAHIVEPYMTYDAWCPSLTLEGLCVYGVRTYTGVSRISA